jgi:hypothetical protein
MAIRKAGGGARKKVGGGVRKPSGQPRTSEDKLRRMGLPQTIDVDGKALRLDGDRHYDSGMPGPSQQGDPNVVVQNGRGYYIQPGQLDGTPAADKAGGLDSPHEDKSVYEGDRGGVNKALGNKARPRETIDEAIDRRMDAYQQHGGDPRFIPDAERLGFDAAAFNGAPVQMQRRIETFLLAGIPLADNGLAPDPGVLRNTEAMAFEKVSQRLGTGLDERVYARHAQVESMGGDPSVLADAVQLGFNRTLYNASPWDMQARIAAFLVAGISLDDKGLAPEPYVLGGAERLSFLLAAQLMGYEL